MKSFSNFCKENQNMRTKEKKQQGSSGGMSRENIQQAYDELKDLNSDELTQKLCGEVRKQKQEGLFDYAGLCDSVEKMRPFISNETYQNMKNMLGKLDD